MKTTEKASNLVEYFWTEVKEYKQYETIEMTKDMAKQCSLFCVEQIENALIDCGELSDQLQNMDRELNFWQNVRKEIETM